MKTIYLPEKKRAHWSYDDSQQAKTYDAARRRDRARAQCDLALGAVVLAKVDESHPDAKENVRQAMASSPPKRASFTPAIMAWAARFVPELL